MLHVHGMCQSKLYKKLVRLPSNYRNFQTLLIYTVYYIKKKPHLQQFKNSIHLDEDPNLMSNYKYFILPVYIESVDTCTL